MNDDLLTILTEQSKAIGRMEAKLDQVVDMKEDVDSLKTSRTYAIGFGAGVLFLDGAYHYFLHKLGLK